jgi:uncharacterized protein (TIGR02646 family)
MHKIERLPEILEFTKAAQKINIERPVSMFTPRIRWECFRNEEQSVYHATREALKTNQHSLCAYCERNIDNLISSIDHFIPKSLSSIDHDYTLNWNNLLLCCHNIDTITVDNFKSVKNMSCNQIKADKDPNGKCLNPYELPDAIIFSIHIVNKYIYLIPNKTVCEKYNIQLELVNSTIDFLNLNSNLLIRLRYTQYLNIKLIIEEFNNSIQLDKLKLLDELKNLYNDKESAFHTTIKLILNDILPNISSL